MIGRLKGKIELIADDYLLLDVNGVGYLIYVPVNMLPTAVLGSEATFLIETQVREDSITLYGFIKEEDKRLFSLLKTVQGVGSKLALAILSKLTAGEIQNLILLEDYKLIQSVPGVGNKVALRIVSELKDKIQKALSGLVISQDNSGGVKENSLALEARAALIALGYSMNDAKIAVYHALQKAPDTTNLQDIIKQSLNYFNSN